MTEKTYNYIRKTFTHAGKRYTVRGKTEREAVRKMIEKQMELQRGDTVSGGKMPVSKWAMIAFETYKPNVSDRYRQDSIDRIKKHVIPVIGSEPIGNVTLLDLQQLINSKSGMSKSFINKLSQEIFFIFDTARKNGMIIKNPAEDLVKPSGTFSSRRALTPEEREHLLAVLPSDPRFVFFQLMLYCGCRPGEAAKVRYEDVTELEGVPFLHIRGTKTVNSDRMVPIPEELRALLLDPGKSGLVALNASGKPHTKESYRSMTNFLRRQMNISMGCQVHRNQLIPPLPLSDDFVPYILRHTYCTDLKKKGVDLRIAKALMGHADIKTTANIYDHTDDDTLMMAAKQMGIVTKSVTKSLETA